MVGLLTGFMNVLGLGTQDSGSSSEMDTGSESETDEDEVIVYNLLEEFYDKSSKEAMGLYQSTDESDELLRILPIRMSLTEEQLAKAVNRKLQMADDQELVGDAAGRLFAPFSADQEQDAWFNGRLINKFMHDLAQRYTGKKIASIDANCANLDTFIDGVSNHGALATERQKLKEANVIFWPICCNKVWYLLIVEKQANHFSIQCLDAYNQNAIQEKCLVFGQQLVQALYDSRRELTFGHKNIKIPAANKLKDSGAVLSFMAEKYCQNYQTKAYSKGDYLKLYEDHSHLFCDYTQFRLYMARLFFSMRDEDFNRGWQPTYELRRRAQKPKTTQTTKTASFVPSSPHLEDEDVGQLLKDDIKPGKRQVPNGKKKITGNYLKHV